MTCHQKSSNPGAPHVCIRLPSHSYRTFPHIHQIRWMCDQILYECEGKRMRACRAPVVCVHASVGVGASECTLRPAAKVDSAGGLREVTSHTMQEATSYTMQESTPHPTPQSTTQTHRAKEGKETTHGRGKGRYGARVWHMGQEAGISRASNTCTYIHIHGFQGLPVHVHTYPGLPIHVHTYIYIRTTYIYVYVYVYIYMCVCVYTAYIRRGKAGKSKAGGAHRYKRLCAPNVFRYLAVCCSAS